MGIFGGPKVSVGLDIGSSWVKMVQLTFGGSGRPQVTKFACEKDVSDPREAVRKIFRDNMLKPTVTVVCLDGQDTEMQVVEFPVKTAKEAEKQAELKLREFNTNEFSINYSLLRGPVPGSDGNQVFPVLYVSAEKAKVGEFQAMLRDAGVPMDSLVLDIDLLAAINALELDQSAVGSVCLIEGGANTTNISVVRDGILRFTYTLKDDGGAVFANHLSQELGVSREEAEALKLRNGIDAGGQAQASQGSGFGASLEFDDQAKGGNGGEFKYLSAFKAEVERYLDKISNIIKDYEDKNSDKIKDVVLTGGFAGVKNISGFMKNYFKGAKMAVENVSLSDSPYYQSLRCPDEEKQAYSVAIGLALRGLAE